MIRKRRYCTSNHWWIISNVQAICVFLQTRWSVKTSIFLCHGIKRWYLREWSIMDTLLNTWYFIVLRSNRFRFLVESERSARDTRELTWDQLLCFFGKKKKNPRASCALSLFLLGGCGAYLGAPNHCFLWNICREKENLFRIFCSLTKAKNRSI